MLNREQADALEILGYVYFLQGRYEQARVIFEGMLTADAALKTPRKHLAAIALATHKPDEALLHLDAYMRGHIPSSRELAALIMKAQAYWMAGRKQESAATLAEYHRRSGEEV